MKIKLLIALMIGMMVIPVFATAGTVAPPLSFEVDMDPFTIGVQSSIDAAPGDTIITSILATVPDGQSISSFAVSLEWDPAEVMTPSYPKTVPGVPDELGWGAFNPATDFDNPAFPGDIKTIALGTLQNSGGDLAPPQFGIFQGLFVGSTSGPITQQPIMYVEWNVRGDAVENIGEDIMFGILTPFDEVFDGTPQDVSILVTSTNGTINIVPEPMSYALFLIGGATLGIRRFLKKRK